MLNCQVGALVRYSSRPGKSSLPAHVRGYMRGSASKWVRAAVSTVTVPALVACAFAALASPLLGQAALVHVLAEDTSQPQVGAIVRLVGVDSSVSRTALTDERGRALFVGLSAGRYQLTAEMIGMAAAEAMPFQVLDDHTVTRVLRLASSPIQLEGLDVELASDRCTVRGASEGVIVARLWEEARKALLAASVTQSEGSYRFETVRYERTMDRDTRVVLNEERDRDTHYLSAPYESRPATDLVENGFVQADGQTDIFYAPDADVLLSDVFLEAHCFHLANGSDEGGLLGLGFRPTGENKSVPDIEGTLWLDPTSAELQWLEYRYQYLEPERTSSDVGGRVDFERMPNGRWIVSEWWIRMPEMAAQPDLEGGRRFYIDHYRQTGGLIVDAREVGGRVIGQRSRTGGIEGVVRDSLGSPVHGAAVGVVGSTQQVFTDAEGTFAITGLPPGRYQVQVATDALEEIGLTEDPVTREVVSGELAVADFHLPSVGELLFETCRTSPGLFEPLEEPGVVLTGVVLDAAGVPVPEATVEVRWNRYNFSGVTNERRPSDIRFTPETRVVEADHRGRYTICEVPVERTLTLSGSSAEGEGETLEFVVPKHELAVVRNLRLSSY